MVGVPGRSKACNTCRKRRIGCDLEKPQCSQCVKSNRVCGGYQRERIWVPNNQVRFEAVAPVILLEDRPNKKTLVRKDGGTLTFQANMKTSPMHANVPAAPLLQLCKPLSQHQLLQQQLFSDYVSNYIPDVERDTASLRNSEKSWLTLFQSSSELTKALSVSFLALSTAALGRQHDDTALIMESRKLYGLSLRELQKALWNPKLMYSDHTLAACLALSLYEVVECPEESTKGWVTHSNGCLRLVELRGPEAHKDGLAHQLFLSCRFNSVIQALPTNRTNFLSKPEWMSIPWSGKISKSLTDRLEDVFVAGTAVLEAAAFLGPLKTTESLGRTLKVLESCWKIDAELRQIYKELEENTPGPLFWPEFSTVDNPADELEEDGKDKGKVFPVAYQYPNLGIAHKCTLYWSSCIILWGGMRWLYYAISAMEPEPASSSPHTDVDDSCPEVCDCTSLVHICGQNAALFSLSALPPMDNHCIMTAARNICQTFEYCTRPEMRAMGAASMAFPLNVAIGVLKEIPGAERELAWARAAIYMINERGFRIVKFGD